MKKFKFLEHTADIKFQAFGKTLNECFINSAEALLFSINEKKVKTPKKIKFKVSGKDFESLMYNFLEEFLFLIDAKEFLPGKVKVNIDEDDKTLDAEVMGDDINKYKIHMHIKAVTYNEMFIKKEKNKWVAQVVLDI